LIFADQPSQLRLLGGTNVDFAPDIDYYETVIFRPIAQRFSFTFDLNIVRRFAFILFVFFCNFMFKFFIEAIIQKVEVMFV